MTIRTNMLDEPNDKLLATLLHISGLAPLYRWQDQRRTMELASAVLYLDAALWPEMTPDQIGAAIEWAAGKCKIKPSQVTLATMPDSPTAPDPDAGAPADSRWIPGGETHGLVPRLRRIDGPAAGDGHTYGDTDG